MSLKAFTSLAFLLRLSTLSFGAPTNIFSQTNLSQTNSSGYPIDFLSTKAPWRPLPLTNDTEFDFELYNALDGSNSPGDILNAASYITPGDFESYANSFWNLANQTLDQARMLAKNADPVTARESFFAASTYFRQADFYLRANPSEDPRLSQLWRAQLDAYGEGLSRMRPVPGRRLNISTPYNFTVAAYYYVVDGSRRPTLIIGTGEDGPQEDLFYTVGSKALQHGWNVITYEGPGQPTPIHEQGKGYIPEWERVVTPVVDWLEQEPTADLSQLTLIGFSMGGFLNSRAAAFDPRIKALVLNGGIDSMYKAFTLPFPEQLLSLLDTNTTAFDEYLYKEVVNNPKAPTTERWAINEGMYTFVTRSPADWLLQSRAYNNTGFIDKVKMPTLVFNATEDKFYPTGGDIVSNQLRAAGTNVTEVTIGGVGAQHDQIGASLEMNRVMWNWLNEIWPPAVAQNVSVLS